MIRVNEYSIVDMYSNSYEVDFCLFGFFDKKFCFVVKWYGLNEIFVLEYILMFLLSFLFLFFMKCVCVFWILISEINKWIRVVLYLFV